MTTMPMLRCYDCRQHATDADGTEQHRAETGHEQWTSIAHELHPAHTNGSTK